MAGGALLKGTQRTLMESQAIAVGTVESPDYWLVEGGGLLVTLVVTSINGATITDLRIRSNHGGNYDVVAAFPALAIAANGRYDFRMAPGASRAPGASAYKGAIEDVPPITGNIEIVNTVAQPTIELRIACVE